MPQIHLLNRSCLGCSKGRSPEHIFTPLTFDPVDKHLDMVNNLTVKPFLYLFFFFYERGQCWEVHSHSPDDLALKHKYGLQPYANPFYYFTLTDPETSISWARESFPIEINLLNTSWLRAHLCLSDTRPGWSVILTWDFLLCLCYICLRSHFKGAQH